MISHILRIILFYKNDTINSKFILSKISPINNDKIIRKVKNKFDFKDPKIIFDKKTQSQISDKNISSCNDVKKKGNEIYRIYKNYLNLILLCDNKKIYFLSPNIKDILSTTPRIETSVFSPNNNFTLGEMNQLIQ